MHHDASTGFHAIPLSPMLRAMSELVDGDTQEAGPLVEQRYWIEATVRGGMGTVCRCRDVQTGATVALKLALDVEGSATAIRLGREIELLSTLRHPAIVSYLGHGVDPVHGTYLVMEWLEGESLATRIARGRLGDAEVLRLVHQLLGGLALAHERGVVHRDIKPSNIFLVPRAESLDVKLIDFGIARTGSQALTRTGVTIGTPGYMAPEQARGGARVDHRADLFALGCLLYELLTGEAPFQGATVWACLAKVLFAEPPELSQLRPDIDPRVAALVEDLLQKEPDARPFSAEAVIARLDAIASEPVPSGAKGRSVVALSEAELRWVTVLIAREAATADLALAQSPADPLDDTLLDEPAGAKAAVRKHIRNSVEVVRRHGGRAERLADGTRVAVFKDGPAAALAVGAARCLTALRDIWDVPAALVTGLQAPGGNLPFAELIERAATLLSERNLGRQETAVDTVTARLLEARFEILGSDDAWLLGPQRDDQLDVRRLLGEPTPCVGRRRELGELERCFEHCVEDSAARALLVTGDPGVGKSRLRLELVRLLRERREAVTIWSAQADSVASGAALSLLAGLVRSAAGLRVGAAAGEQEKRLREHLAETLPAEEQEHIYELFADLLGIPVQEPSPGLQRCRRDAFEMAEELRIAWETFVGEACQRSPVLLILEDLHDGDLASVKFLDSTLRKLSRLPLMIMALARPSVHERFPRLWAQRGLTELKLEVLSERASRELVDNVLADDVDAAAKKRIVALAMGNAFFLEELIRSTKQGLELPPTLLAMAHSRIAGLPPATRRIARAASVFGERFWYQGLLALLGKELDAERLASGLEALTDQELIEPVRYGRFADHREFVFRHALVREAAYASLTPEDRCLGHHLAAEWLEHAGETSDLVLACHFEAGAAGERAHHYFSRAALRALSAADPHAALAHSERALTHTKDPARIGELRGVQGEIFVWMGRMRDLIACQIEAKSNLPPRSWSWYRALSLAIWTRGCLFEFDQLERDVRELFEHTPSPQEMEGFARCCGWAMRVMTVIGRGDVAQAIDARLGALVSDSELKEAAIWVDWGRTLILLWTQSDPFAALKAWERAIARSRAFEDRRTSEMLQIELAMPYNALGRAKEIVETLPDRIDFMERNGAAFVAAWGRVNLAWAWIATGQAERVLGLSSEHFEHLDRFIPLSVPLARHALAAAALSLGDLDLAEEQVRACLELPITYMLKTKVRDVLTNVLIRRGKIEEAAAISEKVMRAVAAPERHHYLPQATLTHYRLCEAQGRPESAALAIAAAGAWVRGIALKIDDAEVRRGYLEDVEENASVLRLAGALLD